MAAMPGFYEASATLPARLKAWARALGFADAGIASLELGADADHLRTWLADGLHGQMEWLAEHFDKRVAPQQLRPGTVTVISARLDYLPDAAPPWEVLGDGERAYVSRYALGRDYHKLLRARLLKLAEKLSAEIGPHGYRVLADSAPALEKALARNAGLGWIGKNTLLLQRRAGSFFFLGEIYTDLPLPPAAFDEQAHDRCGSCTNCLTACPTNAFIGPRRLDARRCISYLTIEHHGAFPVELRPLIGNRIFGCDDCQLVCPWNRYARVASDPAFAPRHGLDGAKLLELFAWDEPTWLARTEGMALRRAGHVRWLRNIAVALGNAPADAAVATALEEKLEHPDDAVREHVSWALARQRKGLDDLAAPALPLAAGATSGAAPQQEQHDQDRHRDAEQPEQDPAGGAALEVP